MSFNPSALTCWIITEGMAGTENQCIGVAEALGVTPVIKRISLRQPWKALSPYLGFEQSWSFTKPLAGPWPDLLITSGRKSVAAARYIKKQSQNKTFTVQIQDPRINPVEFDLLAVPFHDPARGENVIVTDAAPNRLTPAQLETARTTFSSPFENMPAPRVAVLIGGNSKAHKMTHSVMTRLAGQLQNLNASLMITASRRTDETCLKILKTALENKSHTYLWDGSGENPYFGMLAWADYILVTEDSASMLSEAGTTGKPVYMVKMEGGGKRINKLHAHLKELGVIRDFSGTLELFSYAPLRDAQKLAESIKGRMGQTQKEA